MRNRLSKEEVEKTVDLLINKYNISTHFLNELYGVKAKKISGNVMKMKKGKELDRESLCRLLVIREGISLFAGAEKRKLRKLIIDNMDDETIKTLYSKYPDDKKNITSVSRMKTSLSESKWYSGKGLAYDFVKATDFPLILAGIKAKKEELKPSVEIIEPLKKIPELTEYQLEIKEKLLEILNLKAEKTRCMISLPTGGGKTRVAVEAFLDWLQKSFDENKYMLWIAQSEELCEQCISCIQQMWSSREFILPLRIYRFFGKYRANLEQLNGGVVVASINKLYCGINDNDSAIDEILSNVGAMIIDEAHRSSTMMYDVLIDRAKKLTNDKLFAICGLSATPGRNTIMNGDIDKLVNRFQMNLIIPKCIENSSECDNPLDYFKKNKYLSRVKHIIYKSNIEYTIPDAEVEKIKGNNDYSVAQLKKIAMDHSRNRLIVNRLLKINRNEPTLIYACTVDHAKELSTMMNELGRTSAYIDSSTNNTERRITIREFTEGKIEFLFNFGVLTTGFDAPKTRNIVICRPINSDILYEQIIGRGIRGVKFGGTEECTVIDFSDNIHNLGKQQAYLRFQEYWDDETEEEQFG